MTDRKARDRMATVIRSYMNEEITAFEFDESLGKAMAGTDDQTVRVIGQDLWFFYDDCRDHRIVASKDEWDYFNRLLLLLGSDAKLEIAKGPRTWSIRQAIAAAFLILFVMIALPTGFGLHLFAIALPFGPVSMVLAWLNGRCRERTTPDREPALSPFPSVGCLLSVRRGVPAFAKMRYPESMRGRRIRHPIVDKLLWIPGTLIWWMCSPVALLFQMLPERRPRATVRLPEPHGAGDAMAG